MSVEAAGKNPAHVWLGAETGLLKSVDLVKKVATNHLDMNNYGKDHEILRMCWSDSAPSKLFTGHKNGIVRCFDTERSGFTFYNNIPGFDKLDADLVGLEQIGDSFLTCTSKGNVKIWKPEITEYDKLQTGDKTLCTAINKTLNQIAAGGKDNLLKIWDINSPSEPVFKSKNVPLNWLQHQVPIWVTNIIFLENSRQILTTTGTHEVRIYDPKSNTRRPVVRSEYSEYPLTAAALVESNGNQVVVGNTRGEMASFDLRKMKAVLRCYKEIAGSIRALVCHKNLPYVFSCGLDRYLRVHHLQQAKPIHKVYLKSRLNSVLVTDGAFEAEKDTKVKRKIEEDKSDEMWNKMQRTSDSENDSDASDTDSDLDENLNQNKKRNH